MDSLVTGTLQYETGKPHVKLDFEEGRGRKNTYYIKIDLNQNFILALLVLSNTCLNISPNASLIQMIEWLPCPVKRAVIKPFHKKFFALLVQRNKPYISYTH